MNSADSTHRRKPKVADLVRSGELLDVPAGREDPVPDSRHVAPHATGGHSGSRLATSRRVSAWECASRRLPSHLDAAVRSGARSETLTGQGATTGCNNWMVMRDNTRQRQRKNASQIHTSRYVQICSYRVGYVCISHKENRLGAEAPNLSLSRFAQQMDVRFCESRNHQPRGILACGES
jgi:hypothetical protein